MALNPAFAATPKLATVGTGTSPNTNTDGSGTITALATIGGSGARLDSVYCRPLGNTGAATVLRFFVSPTGSTSNYRLIHEETLPINTLTAVAASTPVIWRANLVLPASALLGIAIGNTLSLGWQVTAEYAEL